MLLPPPLRSLSFPTLTFAHPILQNEAVLRLPSLRPQYPYAITDQGFNLRDREFNVTVSKGGHSCSTC